MSEKCIIIGVSHAGAQVAISLRQEGWTGEICVIGDENSLPYHRPPLSKDFLSGSKTSDDLLIRPAALFAKHNIEFILNSTVTHINAEVKEISYEQGEKVITASYNKLALCTGARVREIKLPGSDLPGIHYLRTLADVEAIRETITGKQHGVIVGGGYIGLETASMLNKMGFTITVLEALPQLLARVAAPEIGEFYSELHKQHGVTIRANCQVNGFVGEHQVEGIVLADGETIAADFVIVGIGVVPNIELASAAGLNTANGIIVDDIGQTSEPHIVAAGDCCQFEHPLYGTIRLESVPNATEQAKVAAATMCGKEKPHHSLPWFWSDQYDCKLQIAGLSRGYDQTVVRGNISAITPSFCVYYLSQGVLIAADCINRPKEFMIAKRWITNKVTPDIHLLEDDTQDLKP